jgi:hypothetical protein
LGDLHGQTQSVFLWYGHGPVALNLGKAFEASTALVHAILCVCVSGRRPVDCRRMEAQGR